MTCRLRSNICGMLAFLSDTMQKSFGVLLLIACLLHISVTSLSVNGEEEEEDEEEEGEAKYWPSTSERPLSSQGVIDQNIHDQGEMKLNDSYGEDCQPTKWRKDMETSGRALVVLLSDSFRLRCPADGKPKPSIKWFRNGKEIHPNEKIQLKGYALELKEATSPFDEGEYKCVVENKCGSLQESFTVNVIVRYSKKPVIVEAPKNETVAEGRNVTLTCQILSDAPVYFNWIKVKNRQKKNSTKEHFEYLTSDGKRSVNTTHLIIFNANISDSGQYMCFAANQFGSNNRSAWISVLAAEPSEPENARIDTRIETVVIIIIIAAVSVSIFVTLIFVFCGLWFSRRHHKKFQRFQGGLLVKQWEIPRENIKLFESVGEGEFGIVYRGQIIGTPDLCGYLSQTIVAVKTLKAGATMKEVQDIIYEMNTMKDLGCHPNVIQFIGCCTVNGPLAVVMEYAAHGSLKNFLSKVKMYTSDVFIMIEMEEHLLSKDPLNGFLPLIDSHQLWKFSTQVAKGLEYLASKKIVHRDVAARNVLVAEDLVAKISDFGLTRSVTSSLSDQYIHEGHRCLPIKWMSPESLEKKVFTTKSDVWSFGILLWEIFTYASNPYPTVPIQNLACLLRKGYRMEKPLEASDEMYQVMRNCWQFCPRNRPSFAELVKQLESSGKIKDFIAFDSYGKKNDF